MGACTSLVFVYGTLRQGGVYHSLLHSSRRVQCVRTTAHYELVHLGEYPGMLPSGTTSVTGEIYEVSARTLADLDELEEVPHLYTREIVSFASFVDVWGYLYRGPDAASAPRIPSGDWHSL